jgi:hypothetical protein
MICKGKNLFVCRRAFAALLLFLLLLGLLSCGRIDTASPRALFESFSARYGLMPGNLYDSEVGEEDPAYLPPALFRSLYARPDGSDDREDIRSCVLYLGSSGTVWYEMAIVRCRDRSAAEEVASLCLLRCETVREMRGAPTSTEAAEEPTVLIRGSLVFFFALPDNAKAERIARRLP